MSNGEHYTIKHSRFIDKLLPSKSVNPSSLIMVHNPSKLTYTMQVIPEQPKNFKSAETDMSLTFISNEYCDVSGVGRLQRKPAPCKKQREYLPGVVMLILGL